MPDIEIKNLSFIYHNRKKGEVTALNDLSCHFKDGKVNVIIGPSGCGKTTLLRLISGLEDEYKGTILINGTDVEKLSSGQRNISYVTQNHVLYPHLSIFDNIAFPLKLRKADRDEIIRRVFEVADELDIRICLSRKPKYLSNGQRQRAALAKSLIKASNIYLFDEPLSSIDQAMRDEQRHFIKKFIKKHSATAIYVTHDFKEALAIADEIFLIEDGKLVLSGDPKEIINSDNDLIRAYKESLAFEMK